MDRVTLNLGVRADFFDGWSPEQSQPATAFLPGFSFDRVENTPRWRDVSPRLGVSWDITGDGKTAFKAAGGRYVAGTGTAIPVANNPASAISASTNRTWDDANNDFFPDGDPTNPLANGELGPSQNAAFGTSVITSFFDEDMLEDNRQYTWQVSAGVDRELRDNVRVSFTYFRTMHYNQTVRENETVGPADYDPYCVTAPAGLGSVSGQEVCGFANISFAGRATVPRNVTKNASASFGDHSEVYNGVDVEMNARFDNGALIQGGFNLGETTNDQCFVVDSPQDLYQCNVTTPWWDGNGQVKFSGSYPLPGEVELSAVYQNIPGVAFQAATTFFNDQVSPSLGRNLSNCPAPVGACTATVTLNMLEPNADFEGRIQMTDFRLAKVFRGEFGMVRVTFDLYNAFNAAHVNVRNNSFGTTGIGWGRPLAILAGRLIKIGGQFSWN